MMPIVHTALEMRGDRPRNPLHGWPLKDDAGLFIAMLPKHHRPRDPREAQGLQPLGGGDTIWLTLPP